MSGIQQNFAYGRSFGPPNGWPVNIGDAYGGGFFAGQINVSGTKYNLVIAPKSSGESALLWGTYGVTTGFTSDINGPANSAGEAALGAAYQAAAFCEGLTIGGYTDWYLPARNELEVLYYYLKPTTSANNTSSGSNANAVSPEPVSQNYTSGFPAQTTATGTNGFRVGEANALAAGAFEAYYSSTESSATHANVQVMSSGFQSGEAKNYGAYVRAVRRVLA